ncbi:DUF2158 domain-containing protein [Aeromonas veronii]|uniref:DUF2158 domain-containing protein n=1 Tax=Aeromonas veronii TaxID=654 RepID=UPI001117CB72|nr:DUF2158 domain-containing protein [Aeromonas veronii]TNJ08970.1 hypothetical protein CF107_14750 [Aeromonas veronii]
MNDLFFYPGEVVQLKSGGQRMTVDSTRENTEHGDDVCCVWFNQDLGGEPVKDYFHPRVLKLLTERNVYDAHQQFRPLVGQSVTLCSGGPAMTISRIELSFDTRMVSCIWFDEHNKGVLSGLFRADTLTLNQAANSQ